MKKTFPKAHQAQNKKNACHQNICMNLIFLIRKALSDYKTWYYSYFHLPICLIFTPNNDYTVCIKRETQTVSFNIRSSRLFLSFSVISFISKKLIAYTQHAGMYQEQFAAVCISGGKKPVNPF